MVEEMQKELDEKNALLSEKDSLLTKKDLNAKKQEEIIHQLQAEIAALKQQQA